MNSNIRFPFSQNAFQTVFSLTNQSSTQESFNEVTPVLPKRDSSVGIGAEESSDDEVGSITVCPEKRPNHQMNVITNQDLFYRKCRIGIATIIVELHRQYQPHRREFILLTLQTCMGNACHVQHHHQNLNREFSLTFSSNIHFKKVFGSNSDSSDENADESDHDLTPCNPSPDLTQLLGWGDRQGRATDQVF